MLVVLKVKNSYIPHSLMYNMMIKIIIHKYFRIINLFSTKSLYTRYICVVHLIGESTNLAESESQSKKFLCCPAAKGLRCSPRFRWMPRVQRKNRTPPPDARGLVEMIGRARFLRCTRGTGGPLQAVWNFLFPVYKSLVRTQNGRAIVSTLTKKHSGTSKSRCRHAA